MKYLKMETTTQI